MSQSVMKFDDFLKQAKNNWSESYYDGTSLVFPRIDRVSARTTDQITKIMKDRELQYSDFHLLASLRRSNHQPPFELMPSELCNYMLFSWGGLTKNMKRLQQKGIITRVNCVKDKRVRSIRLTEQGVELIEDVYAEFKKSNKAFLKGFSAKEVQSLNRLLDKIINNIEKG
ncbi:MarR family winged helix-turn-helix transcriptional regulator [Shewanella youngdeokensis]|uniref:HTH marR-type domain-containing protein n=1 Tax=Shewanella youngdeokensis TaxID=2999068 RepID=A0ABZ0K399_9GAMM|nr:hypothetical protein RGE70_09005 [Shewanella sp. DAU334]